MGRSTLGADVHRLARFSRLVSDVDSPDEAAVVLAAAVVDQLAAPAAVVLRVEGEELVVAARAGAPETLAGWRVPSEQFGPELGARLVAACPEHTHAETLPLIVAGDLYGVLVMLGRAPLVLDAPHRDLVLAMVDLAAVAIARATSYAALARSYAELKESRETLARSERLRVLGQMAAGVSHDVKNILNPLGLQLELLRRRLDRGELDRARESIDTMRDVIRHGVDVVDRLREFSRQAPSAESEVVDIDKVVATAVELSRPRLTQHARVVLQLALGAPRPIRARASEITTAVVNLIVNAIEAMTEGGTISVSTGEADNGSWIAVADTGPGMDPETERRVFEPFFTTKAEGTGLGLAMIYAFVQRYDGRVRLETSVGKGTRFTLWFPTQRVG